MAGVELNQPNSKVSCISRIIETFLPRCLVIGHVSMLIVRATTLGKPLFMVLPLALFSLFLIPEAIFTYVKTKATEWKWVCPCILLFTLSTLPQIWVLELDMMEEKQRYQEEGIKSAVEVAVEMQRQAQVDPEQCSLADLVAPGDPMEDLIEQQMAESYSKTHVQERNPFVSDVPQLWKKSATIKSDNGEEKELMKIIDDNFDTTDLDKCWTIGYQNSTVVINFNQVLMIQKLVLYTGNINLDPEAFTVIPLETLDSSIIREKEKRLKYAMVPKRKKDGSYVLDLETNIRSTRVFQYLEIVMKPFSKTTPGRMVLCEIDLQYSDNYLAASGKTEYYQPPIALKASSNEVTDDVTMADLVQRLYDDDIKTCSIFTKLKMLIDVIESTHVYKQLKFVKLQFYPKNDGKESSGDPTDILIYSFDGILNRTLTLDKGEQSIELDPSISLGNNVITIQNKNSASEGFQLCELKLRVVVEEKEYDLLKRKKRNIFSRSDSMLSRRAQRLRRTPDPFEPKSKFALLDDSAEMKATITLVLEQLTMVTLLFIRWIIPRPPAVTREQLAAQLGGWMGMMADQLNFLVLLDEKQVFGNPALVYTVLMIFSVSQLQFSLVYTARLENVSKGQKTPIMWVLGTFLWNSVCILCLQDIPFVLIRLHCVFVIEVVNHTVAYFIGKNFIVIALQLYRIVNLFAQERVKQREHEKVPIKLRPEKSVSFTNGNLKKRVSVIDDNSGKIPWIDDEDFVDGIARRSSMYSRDRPRDETKKAPDSDCEDSDKNEQNHRLL